MNPRALVVIPTYDEAANIEEAIEKALASMDELDVLVVDDGSPDGTGAIVASRASNDSRIQLLKRNSKRGLGSAYVDGFEWGLAKGYEFFIEMDGDLSHDPSTIPALVEATSRFDLVIGSRYIPGGVVEGWSRWRHLLSRAGNLYARIFLGFGVKDSTSGFRCYRRRALTAVRLGTVRSDGYGFQIDMAYRLWLQGFDIGEIPITFVERIRGHSKISRGIVVEAILNVTIWGIRDLVLLRRWRRKARHDMGGHTGDDPQ